MLQRVLIGTGSAQQWVVPDNIDPATPVTVALYGAGGLTSRGGRGGRLVVTRTPPTPGAVWNFFVGTCGKARNGAIGGAGGFNGGGAGGTSANGYGGAGGSGATDLRIGGITLADRIAAAGGAGAAGTSGSGGVLGGTGGTGGALLGVQGGDGGDGQASGTSVGGHGGGGGRQTVCGAGGSGGSTAGDGHDGSLGQGGAGSNNSSPGVVSGAGAGGGWYGGGGGEGGGGTTGHVAASGGGGGGSNGYLPGAVLSVVYDDGQGAMWSSGGSAVITYNARPDQPAPQTPQPGTYVDSTVITTAAWLFSDPDPADLQAAADVRWRCGDGAAWNLIAGAATVGQTYAFPAHTFDAFQLQPVEWQVRAQDSHGAWSDWSASSFFTPVPAPPTPDLTVPSPITSRTVPATVTATDLFTHAHLRVTTDVAGAPGTSVAAGDVDCAPTTALDWALPTGLALTPGDTYHVQVQVSRYDGVESPWVDSDQGAVLADLNAPRTPLVAVTPVSASASVLVNITNPAPDSYPAVSNRLFRQDLTHGAPEVLIADDLDPNASLTDPWPPLNVELAYRAEAISAEGTFTSSA